MKNETDEFSELVEKLKEKDFPFCYIERNTWGVEYQCFIPDTEEFEKEDAINLRDGVLEVLKVLDGYINGRENTVEK